MTLLMKKRILAKIQSNELCNFCEYEAENLRYYDMLKFINVLGAAISNGLNGIYCARPLSISLLIDKINEAFPDEECEE